VVVKVSRLNLHLTYNAHHSTSKLVTNRDHRLGGGTIDGMKAGIHVTVGGKLSRGEVAAKQASKGESMFILSLTRL
jgi:hypothetical protein